MLTIDTIPLRKLLNYLYILAYKIGLCKKNKKILKNIFTKKSQKKGFKLTIYIYNASNKRGREEIKIEELTLESENRLVSNGLITINSSDQKFNTLMTIYEKANQELVNQLFLIKDEVSNLCGYDVITTITNRIKTPESIMNKMKKKHLQPNYRNLVEKIDDVAGIRIVCAFKDDITMIKNIIEEMEGVKILQEKNYIKKPKESGYSAYHLIVEKMIEIEGRELFVKIEIQIRTMTMDFWAMTEHKMRYKSKRKLSMVDSKKLSLYAKIINMIDYKITKLYKKQTKSKAVLY